VEASVGYHRRSLAETVIRNVLSARHFLRNGGSTANSQDVIHKVAEFLMRRH
jgi:hypothetical protein